MRSYRCKKRSKRRRLIWLAVLLIVSFLMHIYFVKHVNPIVYAVAETKVRQLTQRAVNSAIVEVLGSDISFLDLTKISYDSDGKIALIQADTIKLNLIAAKTLENVAENLYEMGNDGVSIPFATMFGIPVLSGYGPDVTVRVKPFAVTEYTLFSEFSAAGINQTAHRIYFELSTEAKAVLPARERTFLNVVTVLLIENIIVGEVPSIYLGRQNILTA